MVEEYFAGKKDQLLPWEEGKYVEIYSVCVIRISRLISSSDFTFDYNKRLEGISLLGRKTNFKDQKSQSRRKNTQIAENNFI